MRETENAPEAPKSAAAHGAAACRRRTAGGAFSGLSTGFRHDGASWRSSGDSTLLDKQKRPGVLGTDAVEGWELTPHNGRRTATRACRAETLGAGRRMRETEKCLRGAEIRGSSGAAA